MQLTDDMIFNYFRFIYERHLIWYKRFVLQQPRPWTDDPIMQQYKIINMYRELDRCTAYLMDKVRALPSRRAQLFNIIWFRFFNADQVYELLGITPFTEYSQAIADDTAKRFERLKASGHTMFNTAYVVSPGPSKEPKHRTILNNLVGVWQDMDQYIADIDASATPEVAFNRLCHVPLAGPFLACEFWTDLAYLHFFPRVWTDDDFVNIGPGAQWGLSIIFGDALPLSQYMGKLRELRVLQQQYLPTLHTHAGTELPWETIAYHDALSNYPYLSLTNVEGALCEFRKYWNLSHGKGRRRKFAPVSGPAADAPATPPPSARQGTLFDMGA